MPSKESILKQLADNEVRYLRLWFTDIMGHNKNIELPPSQFEKALNGEMMFDGSSIEGFSRIEESDMILVPDLNTFTIFPWKETRGSVARLICDVRNPDGSDFPGCPRSCLKRIAKKAKDMGYEVNAGPEAEFFLFQRDKDGKPTLETHDGGGYFDLTPIDKGEDARREIVHVLEQIGFEVEAAHHEVAFGQHEIDFKYGDIIDIADKISTFRFVVRKVALDFDLHATFMPKPIFGINGSGMHTHLSLFDNDGNNAFYDENAKYQISKLGINFIGGLLAHARGFCAMTNPLVNSYKRLVPGFEAPTHLAWSERNRSPLVRVPARRGVGTRAELRMPDPSANPYLSIALMVASGLDGVENEIEPGDPVRKNIYEMSQRERSRLKIKQLPANLDEAIDAMEKDAVVKETLGEHIFSNYIRAKRGVWSEYISQVHAWEIDRYLNSY